MLYLNVNSTTRDNLINYSVENYKGDKIWSLLDHCIKNFSAQDQHTTTCMKVEFATLIRSDRNHIVVFKSSHNDDIQLFRYSSVNLSDGVDRTLENYCVVNAKHVYDQTLDASDDVKINSVFQPLGALYYENNNGILVVQSIIVSHKVIDLIYHGQAELYPTNSAYIGDVREVFNKIPSEDVNRVENRCRDSIVEVEETDGTDNDQ